MSGKLSPRRTGFMKRQVLRLPYDRVFKVPALKARRNKGSGAPQKMWMVVHTRGKDF